MPSDISSAYTQVRAGGPDEVRDADAVACVASHAQSPEDARLLLEVLGLTEAAPLARTLLKVARRRTPRTP